LRSNHFSVSNLKIVLVVVPKKLIPAIGDTIDETMTQFNQRFQ